MRVLLEIASYSQPSSSKLFGKEAIAGHVVFHKITWYLAGGPYVWTGGPVGPLSITQSV